MPEPDDKKGAARAPFLGGCAAGREAWKLEQCKLI